MNSVIEEKERKYKRKDEIWNTRYEIANRDEGFWFYLSGFLIQECEKGGSIGRKREEEKRERRGKEGKKEDLISKLIRKKGEISD